MVASEERNEADDETPAEFAQVLVERHVVGRGFFLALAEEGQGHVRAGLWPLS